MVEVTHLDPQAPAFQAMGAFEGAHRFDDSLNSWSPILRSPDAEILPDKVSLDARTVDLFRNDAFVLAGTNLFRDSIVGPTYRLNCKPRIRMLGLDDVWEREFVEEVEERFTNYAESTDCWADASRHQTFSGLIRLAVVQYILYGECLAISEWLRYDTRAHYKTAFQMIAPDRLCDPLDKVIANKKVKGGVHMNYAGAPLGYYIKKANMGQIWASVDEQKWFYIRARTPHGRPQVIHIVDQQRPHQTRGVSQLVSALRETKILRRFRDLTLQSAAVQASYAATIESDLPPLQAFESLGGGYKGGTLAEENLEYGASFLKGVNKYGDNSPNLKINGAKIAHLVPGTKLHMQSLGTSTNLGENFEKSLLKYLAASLGVSYEELSRDYSETNYSSARAGMLGTFKTMATVKKACADRMATAMFKNWFEEAVNKGEISAMNYTRAPNMYFDQNMDAYTHCVWVGAGRGQIDEFKETQAMIARINARISTREREMARLDSDWYDGFIQIEREETEMRERDILPVDQQTSERQLDIQEEQNNERNNRPNQSNS